MEHVQGKAYKTEDLKKNSDRITQFYDEEFTGWERISGGTSIRVFKTTEGEEYTQKLRLSSDFADVYTVDSNRIKKQSRENPDVSKVIKMAEDFYSQHAVVEEESEFTIEANVTTPTTETDCRLCDANDDATIDIVEALEEYFTPTPPTPKVRTPKVTRTPYKPKEEFTPSTPQEYRQYHGLCNFCNVKVKHHNVAACYVTHGGLTIEEQV